MEMEKINDSTIRVLLENQDLADRGVTVLDLLGSQNEIESFFYSILDEVDVDHEFRNIDAVTFQVLPNRNGLELFISKVDPDNLDKMPYNPADDHANDATTDDIKKTLEQLNMNSFGVNDDVADYIRNHISDYRDERKSTLSDGDIKNDPSSQQPAVSHHVIGFADFEDFVNLVKVVGDAQVRASLFLFKGQYFLDLAFDSQEVSPARIKDFMSNVYEYGQGVAFGSALLRERGKLLVEDNAFHWALHYFK
ncbi:adapter protein MecA [Ligilactobacillus salitolerans]|uniref:Adapter protein MecA n=1 Tax=Ligilactobacillus salitolerans TaxID=1808352 RepID=A0A401IVT2_9LACO|nr:adaptor protein MecA [Ligilactobacillus salitolerans]GBG95650.1 adapter protein MecA [Ligilactobacillus salitolerans]